MRFKKNTTSLWAEKWLMTNWHWIIMLDLNLNWEAETITRLHWIYSLSPNCNKLETDFSVMKRKFICFVIVIYPTRTFSSLCSHTFCSHNSISGLTIQFHFSETDFHSVRMSNWSQMRRSPVHVCRSSCTACGCALTRRSHQDILRSQRKVSDLGWKKHQVSGRTLVRGQTSSRKAREQNGLRMKGRSPWFLVARWELG